MNTGGAQLTPNQLAAFAQQYGGPKALPDIQRSYYLAQALQSIESSARENTRTPGALASNLLADALSQFSINRNNRALANDGQTGINTVLHQPAPWAADPSSAGSDDSSAGGSGAAAGGAAPPTGASQASVSGGLPTPLPGDASSLGAVSPGLVDAVAATGSPSSSTPVNMAHVGDLLGGPGAGTGGAAPDPQAQMYSGLVSRGMSPTGAAGMLGNLEQESGPTLNRNNPQEGAIGAANWRGPRAQAAQAYFAAHGGPTMDNQAGFIMSELGGPESRSMAAIQAAPDVASATQAALGYERPAGWTPNLADPSKVSGWSNRLADALGAARNFGGSASDQNGQSTASTSQADPVPRPLMLATGADPSVPTGFQNQNDGASPSTGGPMPQGSQSGSYQVASNGPVAPPSASPRGGNPQVNGGAVGGSPQGFAPQPFPIQPAQKAQWQRLQSLAQQAPQLYLQQFRDYDQALRQQASAPEGLDISRPNDAGQVTITGKQSGRVYGIQNVPGAITAAGPKMVMGPDGQPRLVQGTGTQQLAPAAPGVQTQQDMTGKITNEAVPNAVQGNQVWNPRTGSYQPLAGLQPTISGSFAPGSVVAQAPGQAPNVVQGPPYTPKDLIEQRNVFKSGDTYKSYVNTASAINSLGTILKQATGNNGIVDMSAFDNLIRAQTGLSARQGNMAMMMEHLGFPAEAAGMVNNIAGNGFTTPEQIKNAYSALRSYAATHQTIAQHELDEDSALAAKGGQNFGLTLPGIDPVPNVPWMGNSNPGGGGVDPNQSLQNARAAIARGAPRAAVIQRLQAAGVNPAGL